MKRLILPVSVFLLFYGYATYQFLAAWQAAKPQAEIELANLSQIASNLVNAEAYKDMLSKKSISRQEYNALLAPLYTFHKSSPNIAHLYTASEIGPDIYSILDTSPRLSEEFPNRPYKHKGKEIEKIPEPDEGLLKALMGEQNTFTQQPTRYESGADIAIYTPIRDNKGKQWGVLALTMNKSIVESLRNDALRKLLTELALYSLLFILTLGIIAAKNREIKSIEGKSDRIEGQFRTMTERIPGAVYIFTTRGKGEKGSLLLLSKGAEELLQITPTEAESNWKELVDLLPMEIRETQRGLIRQAKATSSAWECEFHHPRTKLWLQNKAFPKKDESGNTTWFGVITDISNQKEESGKLESTNEILKQIGQAPDGPTTLNTICQFALGQEDKISILYSCIGDKIYAIAGAGVDETLGRELSIPRQIGAAEGAAASSTIQTDKLFVASISDSGFYNKAEDLRSVLLSEGFKSTTLYPLIDNEGECLGVLEVVRKEYIAEDRVDAWEIQASHLALAALERERNRRKLESNEKRYRTLFESSPIGICETNQKGEIIFSNTAFEKMITPESRIALSGSGVTEGRREIKQRDSALLAETSKIEKASGKFHFITFISNITEQKQKEESAISSKEIAEAANKAKSEFLAVMSHEIRTPLNGVIGFSQILENMDLKEKEKSFVSKIKQSGETLLATINDILSLSKIEAGKVDLEYRGFNLKDAIKICTEILTPKALEKGIYLQSEVSGLPEAIMGDETRIRQILLNLLGNAVKFTSTGGVSLTATFKQTDPTDTKRGIVEIKVKDTGIGISQENQKKLFQPFSQADSSTTRKYGGTGLGLVICRKLADLMHGGIILESQEGEGSTFTLQFPSEKTYAEDQRPAPTLEEDDLLPLNILVAEDDEVNRLVIFEMLKGLGHEIEFAKNGSQALSMAKELQDWADLILMDMRMPEMDGLEATKKIREYERQGSHRLKPIIALTANAMEEDKEKCMAAGMSNYISKPIDIKILKKALKQCQTAKRKLISIDSDLAKEQIEKHKNVEDESRDEVLSREDEFFNTDTNTDNLSEFDAILDQGIKSNQKELENKSEGVNTKPTDPTLDLPEEEENNLLEGIGSIEISQESAADSMFGDWGFGAEPSPIDPFSTHVSEDPKTTAPNEPSVTDLKVEAPILVDTKILDACLEQIPPDRILNSILPSIEQSCRRGYATILSQTASAEEKSNAAHKMCGSLGTFGCTKLESLLRNIEATYLRGFSNPEEEKELEELSEKTLESLQKEVEKRTNNR